MARALLLLALMAVGCVLLAHAEQTESPASKLQDLLNGMQDMVLADPISEQIDSADRAQRELYQERAEAYAHGNAEWYPGEAADTSMLEMEKKKNTPAKGKQSFDKEVQALVKQGLITASVAQRIVALKATSAKNKKGGKKGGKKGKKGGKKGGKKAKKYVAGTGISRGGKTEQGKYVEEKSNSYLVDESGQPIRSLQISKGVNAGCFACQYFLQRTLGALLGPFYSPVNAGPSIPNTFTPVAAEEHTAEPLKQWKQYAATATAPESLTSAEEAKEKFTKLGPFALPHTAAFAEIDAEVDVDADEISAIEIESIAHETLPQPEHEEAMTQYNKWEHFLPEHMRVSLVEEGSALEVDTENDSEGETEGEADADAEDEAAPKKAAKKAAPKMNFSKAVKTSYGQLFTRRQRHAVKSFFSDLCNRRVPAEYQGTCAKIYSNLDAILEELSTGDRADEVCIRHQMCPKSSYVFRGTHTAVRNNI